jgi:branched-chain amino acid transport system substrate-binding protein
MAIPKSSLFVVLIIMLIFLSGCEKNTNPPTSKFIRIGALLPLTGSGASPGESGNVALQIALEEINTMLVEQGRIIPLFDVLVEDTQTDTLEAIAAYNRLKSQGIRLIIGPFSSSVLKTLKPYADADNILLVSPASVASSIAEKGDNVFRLIPNVISQGEAMNALLVDDNIEVLIPVVRDDIWGNELLEAVSSFFVNNGGLIIPPIKYYPSADDFDFIAGKLDIKVNETLEIYPVDKVGVYLVGYGESNNILEAVQNFTMVHEIKWYGNSAFAEDKNILNNTEAASFANNVGLACPSYSLDEAAGDKWKPLLSLLKDTMGRKPEIFAFTTYDALWLAAKTYISTGENPSFSTLKKSFEEQAESYFGVTGWTSLDENGDRDVATYDFWGIAINDEKPEWEIMARFNNNTGVLERY